MAITRVRRVQTNEVVVDQVDLFQSNGFDRIPGLTPDALTVTVFWDNVAQPWVLVDGTNVPNALVSAGSIYWNQIPGSPGYYNVRWRPAGVGFWRIALTYASVPQNVITDYDVIPEAAAVSEVGLRASFVKS